MEHSYYCGPVLESQSLLKGDRTSSESVKFGSLRRKNANPKQKVLLLLLWALCSHGVGLMEVSPIVRRPLCCQAVMDEAHCCVPANSSTPLCGPEDLQRKPLSCGIVRDVKAVLGWDGDQNLGGHFLQQPHLGLTVADTQI